MTKLIDPQQSYTVSSKIFELWPEVDQLVAELGAVHCLWSNEHQ